VDRAWRWCIVRTLRDLRLSIRRGRPISRPNLERLFCRRWHRATPHARESSSQRLDRGRRMIRRLYSA